MNMQINRFNRIAAIIILSAALILPLFTLFVHTAAATGGPQAKWVLEVTFDEGASPFTSGQILAEWTVIVEGLAGSMEASEYLECAPVGNVDVVSKQAIFSGGYISCTMPSFAEAVDTLLNQPNSLAVDPSGRCVCEVEDIDLWVRMRGEPDLVASETHPTFFHPNFNHEVTDHMGLGIDTSLEARLWAPPTWVTTAKGPFTLGSGPDFIGTRLNDCQGGECEGKHRVNSTLITETVSIWPEPRLYVEETVVYIGLDPESGQVFNGTVRWLQVDPGCQIGVGAG